MSETNWNQRYVDGDTPWDKGDAAPGLIDWLVENDIDPDSRILVPGCGCGHDAHAWARAGFETTGVDLSELALNQAGERYEAIPGLAFFPGNFLQDAPHPTISSLSTPCTVPSIRHGGMNMPRQ